MVLVRAEQNFMESFVQLVLFSAVLPVLVRAEQRIAEFVAQLVKWLVKWLVKCLARVMQGELSTRQSAEKQDFC